jgi:1,4-alpha-glucan branching enzyme
MNPYSKKEEIQAVLEARHQNVFAFLGAHEAGGGKQVVRVFQPYADKVAVVCGGGRFEASKLHDDGFFEAMTNDGGYELELTDHDGVTSRVKDPYSFGLLLGEQDMHYFREGTHQHLWDMLGARLRVIDGVAGCQFAVWAPNARRVSVVGDWNRWDGRVNVMRCRIEAGIWEIFIPGITELMHYKFELIDKHGHMRVKSDPMAVFGQHGSHTASLVFDLERYTWADGEWMQRRVKNDLYHSPMSIYEVHPGSWKRDMNDGGRWLSYRELADDLIPYVKGLGFTHIELMGIAEHPFDGSWGYQVTGYYAPTSRFGNPDEFREFVDRCHQRGLGVILDWVPGHFPKDDHGLAKFDGTALYEHEDPRLGEHMDWGTLIFNYGRHEVKNFLVSNALYWLGEFHIDGLRVDAVASMLYLDYSRKAGEWVPNYLGGRENLEAIAFMRDLNQVCYAKYPGTTIIAEESTAWPGVSRPASCGGLGFGFKWNMGWMNDSLRYMAEDPVHRKYHHGEATFAMIYAYDENFILVLSHDEVVHGKGSLINKMPGDRWQKFANLRMFLSWMWMHPGKKLLFMGSEFGQWDEWNHAKSLDWHLFLGEEHSGLQRLVKDINHIYTSRPALHMRDHEAGGFHWLDANDADNSLFVFSRSSPDGDKVNVIVNATPVVRNGYRVGVSDAGSYRELLNSDATTYAGSGVSAGAVFQAQQMSWQGQPWSIVVDLPPLSVLVLGR